MTPTHFLALVGVLAIIIWLVFFKPWEHTYLEKASKSLDILRDQNLWQGEMQPVHALSDLIVNLNRWGNYNFEDPLKTRIHPSRIGSSYEEIQGIQSEAFSFEFRRYLAGVRAGDVGVSIDQFMYMAEQAGKTLDELGTSLEELERIEFEQAFEDA